MRTCSRKKKKANKDECFFFILRVTLCHLILPTADAFIDILLCNTWHQKSLILHLLLMPYWKTNLKSNNASETCKIPKVITSTILAAYRCTRSLCHKCNSICIEQLSPVFRSLDLSENKALGQFTSHIRQTLYVRWLN